MTNDVRDSKVCPACGRTFEWRKRWARTWPSVRWCSERCRRQRDALGGAEQGHPSHEAAILALLAERGAGKTICPSEVLPPDEKQDTAQMEAVRAAARRLVHAGRIVITQRGIVVSPEHARGPIRLRIV